MKTFAAVIGGGVVVILALVVNAALDSLLAWCGAVGAGLLAFGAELGALVVLAGRVCLGSAAIGLLATVLYFFLRQRHEARRMRDGAWAIQVYELLPLTMRIANWFMGRPSPRAIVDQNLSAVPYAVVHDGVYMPAASPEQFAYATAVERTNRARAIAVGDNVRGLPWFAPGGGRSGGTNAAAGRLLAGADNRPEKQPVINGGAVAGLPALPAPDPVTIDQAFADNTPARLALGTDGNGAAVYADLTVTPHLRVHGATRGSGKTNLIQTIAAGAVLTGGHVLVFDSARLKDWRDFQHCAELVDTSDPAVLADGLARVRAIYDHRLDLLQRAGVRDLTDRPGLFRRLYVVISEFGAQCDQARAGGLLKPILDVLTPLVRIAGACGVHFLYEDQVVDRWPRGIAANAAPVIGRCVSDYAGQACGYNRPGVGAGSFAPHTFFFDGGMINAYHVIPALPRLLAGADAPKRYAMRVPLPAAGDGGKQQSAGAVGAAAAGVRAFGGGDPAGDGGDPPVDPGVLPEVENERTNERAADPAPADAGPTELQALVWAWRDANRDGTQAQLRRDFAARGISIARSWVWQVWHSWPGAAA